MKYLMFVCSDPEPDTAPGDGETPIEEWVETNDARGTRLLGERLRPASETVVVRKRDGAVTVTDGPYAESTEWIVGFDVLECADLEAAVAIAADHEMARGGRIELRAFWSFED